MPPLKWSGKRPLQFPAMRSDLPVARLDQALREQVGPLKARLLCDSGVDLDRLNDLRNGLDHLLGQIKALS